MPAYWLVKTEPSTYGYEDLVQDRTTTWDGVGNPVALKHLRSMKKGDQVFVYHTGDEKAVVGIAQVTKAAYPDPKLKDPRFVVVDLKAVKQLPGSVTLGDIKADRAFAGFDLVRISRLSVMPVPPPLWKRIVKMSR